MVVLTTLASVSIRSWIMRWRSSDAATPMDATSANADNPMRIASLVRRRKWLRRCIAGPGDSCRRAILAAPD